jgi:hypothetical protein
MLKPRTLKVFKEWSIHKKFPAKHDGFKTKLLNQAMVEALILDGW